MAVHCWKSRLISVDVYGPEMQECSGFSLLRLIVANSCDFSVCFSLQSHDWKFVQLLHFKLEQSKQRERTRPVWKMVHRWDHFCGWKFCTRILLCLEEWIHWKFALQSRWLAWSSCTGFQQQKTSHLGSSVEKEGWKTWLCWFGLDLCGVINQSTLWKHFCILEVCSSAVPLPQSRMTSNEFSFLQFQLWPLCWSLMLTNACHVPFRILLRSLLYWLGGQSHWKIFFL